MLFCETDGVESVRQNWPFLKNVFCKQSLWRDSNGPHLKVLFDYRLVTSTFRDIFIV